MAGGRLVGHQCPRHTCLACIPYLQSALKERYDATKGTTGQTYDDWSKQASRHCAGTVFCSGLPAGAVPATGSLCAAFLAGWLAWSAFTACSQAADALMTLNQDIAATG